ncbi:MAG: SDR family NAD(P)-dependent oxidoreductase [Acidimicrobiia bacterium]|nr:SDR family NAD(P)-dependent oxidoreductase [Acidimicrobiia bacterium]
MSRNSQVRQPVGDGERTAAAAVRSAALGDASIDQCEVAIRESASGPPSLAVWVVPAGPLPIGRTRQLEQALAGLTDRRIELIPVSAIPLDEQGSADLPALAQVEVVDQAVLDAWESAIAARPEIGRAAVVSGLREFPERRFHLSDLLPDWQSMLAPGAAPPAVRTGNASTPAPAGPLAQAQASGAPRDAAYAVPPTLVEALTQSADRVAGERIYFLDASGGQVALSYRDLLQRAQRILGGLRQAGVATGDRVILQLAANDDILEAFWGCVLGGFVPVIAAVPKAYDAAEREFQQLCRVWEAIGRPWIILPAGQVPSALGREMDAAQLLALDALRNSAADEHHHAAKPEDVAFFSLTSGSTGTPKSVMLTHRCVLQRAAGVNQLCDWGSHDVVINWLPLDHIGSISDWHIRCVPTGCTLVYVAKEYVLAKPLRWLDVIDRFRGTHSWAPNFAYSLVNRALDKDHDRSWDLSCLKTLLSAGEAISADVVDKFLTSLAPHQLRRTVIGPAFGMAETGSGITYYRPTDAEPTRIFYVDRQSLDGQLVIGEAGHPNAIPFVSLGPPIPGVTLKIVGPQGETLPEQRIGQLYISGDAVSAGYFRDGAATKAVFRDDGWFDSGDLAFLSGGELVITGRAKESLIINGANFYNSEIEAAVEDVPGVTPSFSAACAVRPTAAAAESVAIFFHTPVTDDAHLRDLIGNIRSTLARKLGLKPDVLLPVTKEAIPKSPIGKLLRSQLSKRFESGEFAAALRRVDLLLANEHTIPDWFFRRVWQPKQQGSSDAQDAIRHLVLLGGGDALFGALHHPPAGECRRIDRSGDLIDLVRSLSANRPNGQTVQLDVVVCGAHVVRAGDAIDADRAAVSGLVKTFAAEQPWLSCRVIDVPADAGIVPALLEELAGDRADAEVALRADGRFVPRLAQAAIAESAGDSPFKIGGRYVINGSDAMGREIERYLVARLNAKVVLLDGDPGAIAGAVQEFESANGTLDGAIHICAAHRERAVLDETADGLAAELAGDVDGCRQLAEIARHRRDCLFVAFTSATGFFGGATAAAIASGAASVTAIVEALRGATTAPCFTFAWSAWSHQADGAGESVQLARAAGFHPVSMRQGLVAFLAGLRMGPGSYLVGLDGQHPRVRSKVSNAPVALTQPVVCCTSPSLIDPSAFAAVEIRDRYGVTSRARFQQLQEPEAARRVQPELWPSVAEYFVYDDLLYHVLAHDERRNHSYRVAIEQAVKDKIVVEIGTGREAILARFCAEAGARKVYAIEIGTEAFRDASALVEKLGLQDVIHLIHGDATRTEIPELADVCVSEIVGPIGGCEGAAVLINDARRFLKPGGLMIPGRSVTKIAAATFPDALLTHPGFNEVPGSYVPRIFDEIGRPFDLRLCIKNFDASQVISTAAAFEDLDYNQPIALEETHAIELTIDREARLDGFVVWLNLHTIDGEVIDTLQYEYCWLPVFVPVFDPGVHVAAGDRLVATIERTLCENRLNPDFRVRGRLLRGNGEPLEFAHDSLHHETPYGGTSFYRRLFERDPNGWFLDGYRRDVHRKLKEMPVTADGAIDRERLPVVDRSGSGGDTYVAPGTPTEQAIAAIWQDVLEVGEVSLHGNFFQLGGHSLLLVQMHERLREEFDSPVTLVELFKYPTVSSLAQFIDGGQDAASTAAAQGREQAQRRRARRSHVEAADTDVAVIGMSCRFPGADDVDTFWKNLAAGVESITFFTDDEIKQSGIDSRTADDPNYVKASSVLSDIAGFDPEFFGISTREAALMDPQQRLFLECAWESLEDAGYDPLTYQGMIGIYAGASMNTYLLNQVMPNRDTLDSRDDMCVTTLDSLGGFQLMIGNDKDYLPTQAAYRLNLRGPAVNVQTACSTTLVTIHLAVRSLLDGECDICLAGGASIKVPQQAGHLFQDGMIVSPDGHCRAFDAKAQGTIFGSGIGIVALKRARDAVADGDHIYAIVKGTAVNNDGATKVGYMSPSGDGQASVAAEALAVANVSPGAISYIEAHGTGTELGDPIEIAGLNQAFRSDGMPPRSVAIGSVKTNIGHMQIVSGAAGFIKTALALHHKQIPASLHFERPNPSVDFDSTPFFVNTTLTDWQSEGTRLAGVNSLGIGGTNAHVILEEAPAVEVVNNARERPAHVLALSGKTEQALWDQVDRYVSFLADQPEGSVADICFTANAGRHHFDYRLAVVGRTIAELRHALVERRRQQREGGAAVGPVAGAKPRIVFLFTGQGAQYPGMCRELYETQPAFRRVIDRCQEILAGELDVPLLDVLYSEDRAELIHQTAYTQPALFAVEYALAELWRAWGVRPDACLGHSVGEYVAACLAGVFSLEDGLRLVAARGRLMQKLPASGAMVMVHAGVRALVPIIAPHRDQVSIAAINSPSNSVLSGRREALQAVVSELDAAQLKWQMLPNSHAFHSPLMEPMLDEFERVASSIAMVAPAMPVISNRDGLPAGAAMATAAYWRDHAREAVDFMAGVTYLERQGPAVFIEIGPHPALLAPARETWTGSGATWLHSSRRNRSDWDGLLAGVAGLHVLGGGIDWAAFDQDYRRRRRRVPTYPFQRRQCWMSAPAPRVEKAPLPQAAAIRRDAATGHDLLGRRIRSAVTLYENELAADAPSWLGDHRVFESVVTPAAATLEMVLAAATTHFKSRAVTIENAAIHQALVIPAGERRTVQLVLEPQDGGAAFKVLALDESSGAEQWPVHLSGWLSARVPAFTRSAESSLFQRPAEATAGGQWYRQCQEWGADFGPAFCSIEWLHRGDAMTSAMISVPDHVPPGAGYTIHPMLLDGALQAAVASLPEGGVQLPLSFDRLDVRATACRRAVCQVKRRDAQGSRVRQVDVELFDADGQLLARLAGLTLRPASREALRPAMKSAGRYQLEWKASEAVSVDASRSRGARYLVIADSETAARRVVARLRHWGASCIVAVQAEASARKSPHEFSVDLDRADAVRELLTTVVAGPERVDGVFYVSVAGAADTPAELAERDCVRLLNLVQAGAEFDLTNGPSLCVVTRGAQPVGDPVNAVDPAKSALWGMAVVLSLEHSEWQTVQIDVDRWLTEQGLEHAVDEVLSSASLASGQFENRVAYRDGTRYVARLGPAVIDTQADPVAVRADATYLITGGVGGVGLKIAGWLAARGAGTIVLTGRRGARESAVAEIAALRQRGVRVVVESLEVSDAAQVAALVQRINTDGSPLKGVIHAAGVLDDAILMRQQPEQFVGVLQPKTQGGWNLHQETQHLALDFFVLCSSMAAVAGSPGQANYAAANAFLDGLAWHRRERELPALSINWGIWEGVGVAARVEAGNRRQLEGFGTLSSDQAVSHLESLVRSTSVQIGVSPIDVPRLPDAFRVQPLFRSLLGSPTAAPPPRRSFRDRLNAAPAGRRRALLDTFVQDSVAAILGVNPAELMDRRAGFSSLGMDSLATLELRNRLQAGLGESLPAALAFHYPNLETLTGFLATGVLDARTEAAAAPAATGEATAAGSGNDVDDLLARMASLRETLDRSN